MVNCKEMHDFIYANKKKMDLNGNFDKEDF